MLLAKLMVKAHMISQVLVTQSWKEVALCRAGESDVVWDHWPRTHQPFLTMVSVVAEAQCSLFGFQTFYKFKDPEKNSV